VKDSAANPLRAVLRNFTSKNQSAPRESRAIMSISAAHPVQFRSMTEYPDRSRCAQAKSSPRRHTSVLRFSGVFHMGLRIKRVGFHIVVRSVISDDIRKIQKTIEKSRKKIRDFQ
jgi:hypothetical protein